MWAKEEEEAVNLNGQGDLIREYIESISENPDEVIRLKDGPESDGNWGQFLIPGPIVEKYAFKTKIHNSMEPSEVSGLEIKMSDWSNVIDKREGAQEEVEETEDDSDSEGENEDGDEDDDDMFEIDDLNPFDKAKKI